MAKQWYKFSVSGCTDSGSTIGKHPTQVYADSAKEARAKVKERYKKTWGIVRFTNIEHTTKTR